MRLVPIVILLVTTNAFAATGVTGDWKTPTGAVMRVEPCGSAFCLKIVKLDPHPPATTDINNPDAALRNRPMCGLTVGTAFHPSDPDHLAGGRLYDPRSGKTYKGTITAEGDTLKLHGYVGISLLGRTETWQRSTPIEACH